MRGTALWLVTAAVVATGSGLARALVSPLGPVAIVFVAWPLAIALTIGAVVLARHRALCLAAALLLVALVRGLVGDDRGLATALPASTRGVGAVVRTFAVREASWPGPRCQILAVPDGVEHAAWLELPTDACPLASGDRIAVPAAALSLLRGPAWPAGPDPVDLARSRGASWALVSDRAWLRERDAAGYWSWIAGLRSGLWSRSRGDDARAFVVSSLFGVRSALSSPRRRELAVAGLGHLIAVSGMQVSLVAWATHRALLRLLAPWVPSIGLAFAGSWIGVLAYVGLVGAEAPAVRAAIMVAALGLAAVVGRPAHGLTVLLWTSALMLMLRPTWAFDVGFQLSFAAMAAILRMPTGAGLALQSWRVGWVIMPVLVWHFGETGAWSVPANAIAVPVFTLWVTPLGIGAIALEPWLGDAAWSPASWGAALVLDVAEVFAAAPRLGPSSIAAVAAVAFALGMWPRLAAHPRWQRWAPSRAICVLVVAAAWLRSAPSDAPHAEWIAFGSARTPTLIVRPADGPACVREPTGTPHAWPPLLEALHVDEVGVIAAGAPRHGVPQTDAPHVVALRAELAAAGRLGPATPCVEPTAAERDAALRTCARWGERPFAAVALDGVHCFVAGDWRGPFRLQSPRP